MVNSLAKIKVELVNLFLEKVNDSVTLDNESITLNNLILSMLNSFFPLGNNFFLGSDSGLEFLNLRILPANLITIPLGYAGQSIYTMLLWQNQPELYRLKYASPLQRAPTCFKRYNPLACRVASR
jgi:hypothetical protein